MTSEHKKVDIIFQQYQKRIFKILSGNKRLKAISPEDKGETLTGEVGLRPWGIKTEN